MTTLPAFRTAAAAVCARYAGRTYPNNAVRARLRDAMFWDLCHECFPMVDAVEPRTYAGPFGMVYAGDPCKRLDVPRWALPIFKAQFARVFPPVR